MSYNFLDKSGLTYFWGKIKDKFDSFSRNDLAILESKEYSGIYGSANDQASASFYFGTIRPTNWYDMWKIRFRVYASVPNQNNYRQYSDVTYYGNQTEVTYKIENKMYSTSYRSYYYNNLCKLNATGYNAGYSYIPGIGLRNSNNPTSSSYPRTFKIEILETENCTFTFYDAMKKIANISEYNTTNYVGISEYDGSNNGLRESGDDTNTYELRHANGNYISSTALYRYMLCLSKNETTLTPLNAVNNSTATTKTLTTEEFNPFGQFLYYNTTTTINANASIPAGNLMQQSRFDLRYSFNTGTTLTTNKDIFIVAVPQSNGKAKLHTTPITQTLPTSENGLIYIYLGHAYSNYQIEMHAEHPIYQYKNGSLRLYSQYEDYARNLTPVSIVGSDVTDTAGWYKIASSTMSGYGNQNLLYLIKDGYMNGSIGILDLEMRSDNTSIQCWQVKWLSRHIGIGENTVRIVIDGMTWTMYFKRTQSRYGRVYFTEISNRAINGQMPTFPITYYNSNTPEETEPEPTIYSQDGSIVLRAQQDAGGNLISSTYATKSQLPTKVSQLTNDSGFITNEHVTDVRINGTSILGNKVADIITNTAYNSSTNKIATMADVSSSSDYIIEFPSSWSSVIDEYEQAGSPDYFSVDILANTYSGIDSDHEHYFVNTDLYNAIDRIMQGDIAEVKLNLNNTTYDNDCYVSSAYVSANGNDTLDFSFNDNAYVVSQDLGSLSISGKYTIRNRTFYTISCGQSYLTYFSNNAEFTSNKVTSISSSSTNTQYPSALAVYNYVNSAGGGITIDDVYPVGSIYMSVNNTNPSTLFGGTWEQLKDRFLLGAGDTYTAGNTGGEATHQLTKAELPAYDLYNASHSHSITSTSGYNGKQGNNPALNGGNNQGSGSISVSATIKVSSGGSNQAHNNMPPYLVVYMWKRTA